jgi:hypothetical protein
MFERRPVRAAVLVLLFASGAAAVAQLSRGAAEYVVSGNGIVPVNVGGVPGRARIDPAAFAMPLLNTGYANRARLKPGPFAFVNLVGPQEVRGVTAVARIGVDNAPPLKRRVGWTERPFFEGADATLGPGALRQPVIRFVLRPSLPGERTVALPLVDEGGMLGGWGGLYAMIQVGGQPLRVRFNPYHPHTLATAGAGVRIAASHDGRIGGETRSLPIAYGIRRPVRALQLERPLQVGPLSITALDVRTADFGNAGTIREQGGDPDEIVVTGRRKRNISRDRLWLGADQLQRCSSIVFDKKARRIRLTCA